ncbi:hypothetical protein ACP4OV_010629 [Aristida adscensionis]
MDDPILVGGPSRPPPASVYDDMFESYFNRPAEPPSPSLAASSSPSTPPPVFDKPVFDDDPDAAEADPFDPIPLFGGGVGGVGGGGEDFLDGLGSEAKPERGEPEAVTLDDDLVPGLGVSTQSTKAAREVEPDKEALGFDDDLFPVFGGSTTTAPHVDAESLGFEDDVIPGFGAETNHHDAARSVEEARTRQENGSVSSSKMSVSMPEDPFVILGATHESGYSSFGLFSDHLDNIGMPAKSENIKVDEPPNTSGMFGSFDMFSGFPNAMPSFSFASEKVSDTTERTSVDNINSTSHSNQTPQVKPVQQASTEIFGNTADALENIPPKINLTGPSVIHEVSAATVFPSSNPFARDMPDKSVGETEYSEVLNDVWLTVSDIALVTLPTTAPPPSRPPPPLRTKKTPIESVSSEAYHHTEGCYHSVASVNTCETSPVDELENFVMAKPAHFANGHTQFLNHEGSFMDWASDSMFTGSQYQKQEMHENAEFCAHKKENTVKEERLENEQRRRELEEERRRAEREREEELEKERERVRRREEEQKRLEKEREARQAVEKAIREARERAAAEARMQAEREARRRVERAAVQRAAAEARERAAVEARERAAKAAAEAKERAAAEARERAAAESRERAATAAAEARERAAAEAREKAAAEAQEKAAAEARAKAERAAVEKAAAEARRRAERAAFERVAAEARQRAANEARERAAAEARAKVNQQRTAAADPDLESIFGMPSRSSSVPRSQTTTTNPFDVQPEGSSGSGAVRRTPSGSASSFTQPSASNLMDDLSSIFGAPSSSAVFQEVDGETEERRKARLDRHQRTMERAAKALAEKNERDLQAQREQEERHRIGDALDFEIKRWTAGKEGNLRALLSTLQYVLWPECGWRPVSLTDLITAASVKKEYRKATLCVHPDKVQQKGANLQQKYIAEKVFDLLKEAWNKFNSEEMF